MTTTRPPRQEQGGPAIQAAAVAPVPDVLTWTGSGPDGLAEEEEVARRRSVVGPNAVRTSHARALVVLARQMRSAFLVLLLVTAGVSFALGARTGALIITAILAAGIGLGFVNEYRAERAADALHSAVRHTSPVVRGGAQVEVDVTDLVPGDIVHLQLGAVVPADLRLLTATGLECNESILTGETAPAVKRADPVAPGTPLAELASCALMGTVVRAGTGVGVVVATGARTEFGRIAVGLGERQPETEFQIGLRRFSVLLLQVAVALSALILVTGLILARPLLESLLFALAIAVGITPQLLPAVVSTSLATGSRRLARRKVVGPLGPLPRCRSAVAHDGVGAVRWDGSLAEEEHMIERISGLPAGVVGVRAVGKLTVEDYETVVAPIVDEITRGKGRSRVLVEIGPGFEGVTPAAAWDDIRLGLRAVRSLDGCAVVSDQEWIRTTSRVVGLVTPFPIRVFPLAERDAALAWLTSLPAAAAIKVRTVERGIVVEISEPLRTEDFARLGQVVDSWLADHAVLPGMVVHARRFPGWATPGSFVRHVGFVLGHHRRIERIAIAVGGRLPAVLAPVAQLILHPEVRRFDYDSLTTAIDWAMGPRAD